MRLLQLLARWRWVLAPARTPPGTSCCLPAKADTRAAALSARQGNKHITEGPITPEQRGYHGYQRMAGHRARCNNLLWQLSASHSYLRQQLKMAIMSSAADEALPIQLQVRGQKHIQQLNQDLNAACAWTKRTLASKLPSYASTFPHWSTASLMEPLNMSILALRNVMYLPVSASSTEGRRCRRNAKQEAWV